MIVGNRTIVHGEGGIVAKENSTAIESCVSGYRDIIDRNLCIISNVESTTADFPCITRRTSATANATSSVHCQAAAASNLENATTCTSLRDVVAIQGKSPRP